MASEDAGLRSTEVVPNEDALARIRTGMPCGAAPSRQCVYQFHHQGGPNKRAQEAEDKLESPPRRGQLPPESEADHAPRTLPRRRVAPACTAFVPLWDCGWRSGSGVWSARSSAC